MQQAGKELGLDETQARQLSLETFLGAAKLANQKMKMLLHYVPE